MNGIFLCESGGLSQTVFAGNVCKRVVVRKRNFEDGQRGEIGIFYYTACDLAHLQKGKII